MRILFIHGRGQQDKEEVILKNEWVSALRESFDKAGLIMPGELVFDFPYFGNQLIALQQEYQEKIDSGEYRMRGPGLPEDPALELEQQLLMELAENAEIDLSAEPDTNEEDYKSRDVQNSWPVITLARIIDRWIAPGGNYSIRKKTKDVAAYLAVGFIRNDINHFVRSFISDQPTIIIAHSLGTIIAYDVLSHLHAEHCDIRGLITLGSPLGVKAVKRQLPQGVRRPEALHGDWLNIYDTRDIVSLYPLDERHFNISPPVKNIVGINATENRHGISQYLNDPEIAIMITKLLLTGF
ncbi:hypothetical protein VRU48_15010 [Pedobacter sp. KR3-3]|uniref:Alpha/beta hydrolase n=1 Tax=Pedobacter albus TaxID=3113905 RepID=A0ABU7IAP4_9SPHI|nr:hypothetical protein [Pedobacter sp. KR3-3]MEE1946432.1 hypothetical protein [Pedobacter sp. KR3-3]